MAQRRKERIASLLAQMEKDIVETEVCERETLGNDLDVKSCISQNFALLHTELRKRELQLLTKLEEEVKDKRALAKTHLEAISGLREKLLDKRTNKTKKGHRIKKIDRAFDVLKEKWESQKEKLKDKAQWMCTNEKLIQEIREFGILLPNDISASSSIIRFVHRHGLPIKEPKEFKSLPLPSEKFHSEWNVLVEARNRQKTTISHSHFSKHFRIKVLDEGDHLLHTGELAPNYFANMHCIQYGVPKVRVSWSQKQERDQKEEETQETKETKETKLLVLLPAVSSNWKLEIEYKGEKLPECPVVVPSRFESALEEIATFHLEACGPYFAKDGTAVFFRHGKVVGYKEILRCCSSTVSPVSPVFTFKTRRGCESWNFNALDVDSDQKTVLILESDLVCKYDFSGNLLDQYSNFSGGGQGCIQSHQGLVYFSNASNPKAILTLNNKGCWEAPHKSWEMPKDYGRITSFEIRNDFIYVYHGSEDTVRVFDNSQRLVRLVSVPCASGRVCVSENRMFFGFSVCRRISGYDPESDSWVKLGQFTSLNHCSRLTIHKGNFYIWERFGKVVVLE